MARNFWIAECRPEKDADIVEGLKQLGVPGAEENISNFIRKAMRNEIKRRKGELLEVNDSTVLPSPAPEPKITGFKIERADLSDEELEKNLAEW